MPDFDHGRSAGADPAGADRATTSAGNGGSGDNGARRRPADDVLLDGTTDPNASERTNEALGGRVSGYTCPECHGALWEINDRGGHVRYRCRVGHAYGEAAMLHAKGDALEAALWTALTALEENASLVRRIADRAEQAGRHRFAARYAERAERLMEQARTVRDVLSIPATVPHAGGGDDAEMAGGV